MIKGNLERECLEETCNYEEAFEALESTVDTVRHRPHRCPAASSCSETCGSHTARGWGLNTQFCATKAKLLCLSPRERLDILREIPSYSHSWKCTANLKSFFLSLFQA